ncbi:MAG: hypothetical protein ACJAYU_002015 [Bradymonadia bacterium]
MLALGCEVDPEASADAASVDVAEEDAGRDSTTADTADTEQDAIEDLGEDLSVDPSIDAETPRDIADTDRDVDAEPDTDSDPDANSDMDADADAAEDADTSSELPTVERVFVSGLVVGETAEYRRIALPDVEITLEPEGEGETVSGTSDRRGNWAIPAAPGTYRVCWSLHEQGECGELLEFTEEIETPLPLVVQLDLSNTWGTLTLPDDLPCTAEIGMFGTDIDTWVEGPEFTVRTNFAGEFVFLNDPGSATARCGETTLDLLAGPGDIGTLIIENNRPVLSVRTIVGDSYAEAISRRDEVEIEIEVSDPDGERVTIQVTALGSEIEERDGRYFFRAPADEEAGVIRVYVLATDVRGAMSAAEESVRYGQTTYPVNGRVYGREGAPIRGVRVSGGVSEIEINGGSHFETVLDYSGRRALTFDAPGHVPRVVEASNTYDGLQVELEPCVGVPFSASENALLQHPARTVPLSVSIPAGALQDLDGVPVTGDAVACMSWLDGDAAASTFGTLRVAPTEARPDTAAVPPGAVGHVEPTGVGFVRFHAPGDPSIEYFWGENPDLTPSLLAGGEASEPPEGQEFANLWFDLERGSWEIDGEGDGIQALVLGDRPGGPIIGGTGLVPMRPEITYPFWTGCVVLHWRGGPDTVEIQTLDAAGVVLRTTTRPITHGTNRIVGLPIDARVRLISASGGPAWKRTKIVEDTGLTTTPMFYTGGIFPRDCAGEAVLPYDPSFAPNLRYTNTSQVGYQALTNATIAPDQYTLNSWMVDNGWPHTGGVPTVSPFSGDDADVLFNSQSSSPTARRLYAHMDGPPGDADIAMLLSSSGGHGLGSSTGTRNWLGISFRRVIPSGPRVTQFFWFNVIGGQNVGGGSGSWAGNQHAPHTCQNCHGGYITSSFPPDGNLGASFSPLELKSMTFTNQTYPGSTRVIERASQEDAVRLVNEMLLSTNLTTINRERILGLYGVADPAALTIPAGTTQNDAWRPPVWDTEPELYDDVVRPACLSCHGTRGSVVGSPQEFRTYAATIQLYVCEQFAMPIGEPIAPRFWNSTHPHQPNVLVEAMQGVPGWTTTFCR